MRAHTLKPAQVPFWWMNNPRLGEFCLQLILLGKCLQII